MDLEGCIRAVIARRLVIFASIAGCLFGGALVVELVPPRYVATSRVLLEVIKPDPVSGAKMSKTFAQAFIQTQVELIRDYRVAGDVVDVFGWTSSPELLAVYSKRPESDQRDFRRWLAQIVIDSCGATLIDGTNILQITFVSTSPRTARKGADAVRDAYISRATLFRRAEAMRTAQWFDQQAQRVAQELSAKQERLAKFEQANGVIIHDDADELTASRLTAIARNNRNSAFQIDLMSPGGAGNRLSPGTVGPGNQQSVADVGNSLSAQARIVLAKRGVAGEASLLNNEVQVLKKQYEANRLNADKLTRESSAQGLGITKLGNTDVPQTPAFPDPVFIGFASLALGLIFGIVIALLIELLDRRVRHPRDLEEEGLQLIGAIRSPLVEPQTT